MRYDAPLNSIRTGKCGDASLTGDVDCSLKLALFAANFAGKNDLELLEKAIGLINHGPTVSTDAVAAILESEDPVRRAEGMKSLREMGKAIFPALREIAVDAVRVKQNVQELIEKTVESTVRGPRH